MLKQYEIPGKKGKKLMQDIRNIKNIFDTKNIFYVSQKKTT